jgi:hypothetical protein
MRKKIKKARFSEGTTKDGSKFKSWLTVCPFPECSKNIRIADETNETGFFERIQDERCEHVRFVYDNGEIEFVK